LMLRAAYHIGVFRKWKHLFAADTKNPGIAGVFCV